MRRFAVEFTGLSFAQPWYKPSDSVKIGSHYRFNALDGTMLNLAVVSFHLDWNLYKKKGRSVFFNEWEKLTLNCTALPWHEPKVCPRVLLRISDQRDRLIMVFGRDIRDFRAAESVLY